MALKCAKCGSTDEIVEVAHETWKFVPIGEGYFNLCYRCYNESGGLARAYLTFNTWEYEQIYGRKPKLYLKER